MTASAIFGDKYFVAAMKIMIRTEKYNNQSRKKDA